MLTCPVAGDVNFDYSVKVVTARFLHCKVTSYSFTVNRHLGDTLKLCKYPVSFSHSPIPNLNILQWILLATFITVVVP